MPFLKQVVNGHLAGVIELGDIVHIGRSHENDIVIEDPTVSQIHARVCLLDGAWFVEDCESTNGIRVNGQLRHREMLVDGVIFSVGTQEFEFSVAQPGNLDKTLKIKKSWIPGVYYTK